MLKCNGKTFMNIQEAVQWLLCNNALIFQCSSAFVADTDIPLEDLVNPSPANPKIGSLVLFSDAKVATVTDLGDGTFEVGAEYVDLSSVSDTDLEDIVDKDGHKRFIEGEIVMETITGLTQTYGRWSLSGTHLMIVIAGSLDNGAVIPSFEKLASISVPAWVKDKIIPLKSYGVSWQTPNIINEDWTTTSSKIYLENNPGETTLTIVQDNSVAMTQPGVFRYQFDFLIDDE